MGCPWGQSIQGCVTQCYVMCFTLSRSLGACWGVSLFALLCQDRGAVRPVLLCCALDREGM